MPIEGVAATKSSPAPLVYTMIPPVDGGHGLTHEQVMPFLKKLESGQQREGKLWIVASGCTFNNYETRVRF